MRKITFREYMEMVSEAEETYGALSENDWNNPLLKEEDMPGITLTWDMDLQEWCVFGPLNQRLH